MKRMNYMKREDVFDSIERIRVLVKSKIIVLTKLDERVMAVGTMLAYCMTMAEAMRMRKNDAADLLALVKIFTHDCEEFEHSIPELNKEGDVLN